MPVSGLVVTLSEQVELRAAAIDSIRNERRIEIGESTPQRLAIVMDTQSTEEDRTLWNWLNQLPGVTFVDVVMVGFEDPDMNSPTAMQFPG